jgi:hypothetical protein
VSKRTPNHQTKFRLLRNYFRGFGIGLCIVASYFFLMALYGLLLSSLYEVPLSELKLLSGKLDIVSWLAGWAMVYLFVKRYKLMHGWLVAALIFGVWVIPFMLGDRALKKE